MTIEPSMTISVMKKRSTNHTAIGAMRRRMKFIPYMRGWINASFIETLPSERPMHIIESGMQASESIPATSSTISGIGISNMKIIVAITVAMIGTFIMLLRLSFSFLSLPC